MRDEVYWLGCCPALEDAVQVGVEDYDRLAQEQCRRYQAAIRLVLGDEPAGARLTVRSQSHDYGRYYECAVVFDPSNEAAREYAERCERQAPTTWAAAGMGDGTTGLRDTLEHVAATLKLRHIDEASDEEVEEALAEAAERLTGKKAGKRYIGEQTPDGLQVVVVDPSNPDGSYLLDPRYDLRNHSPTGFSAGYSGSGPAQLALALCADALGDDERAQAVYQDFKFKVIARIDADRFEMTADEVRAKVNELEAERGRRRS